MITVLSTETPAPYPLGHCARCRMPYNLGTVVQPEGNNICKYYSFFVSPYYTVNDGINQVNNYGRNQPKTRVKQKNIFMLHKYNTYYITKFSTSFHLGGLWPHIRCDRVPIKKEQTGGGKNQKYLV